MPLLDGASFTAPAAVHEFAALLFDMDGTIIDSTAAIEQYWRGVGKEIGVDGDYILQTSHGRRSIDVLAQHAPHLANWEHIVPAEARIPLDYGSGASMIPGARELLASVAALPTPHAVWAIVTSGTAQLVAGWLRVMGLAQPGVLVSAEQVEHGKPAPACYLLGARRLAEAAAAESRQGLGGGDDATTTTTARPQILVLEDAPAGIRAGRAAGFRVLAVATTHAVAELRAAGAEWIVRDLRSVRVLGWEGKRGVVRVQIADALEEA